MSRVKTGTCNFKIKCQQIQRRNQQKAQGKVLAWILL